MPGISKTSLNRNIPIENQSGGLNLSGHKIATNFKRKERAGRYEDQRQILATELRHEGATRMEGSFGTEKQHYSLDKIKHIILE